MIDSTLLYLTGFVGCTILIFNSGKKLVKYGDKIAEFTGLGRAWIGLILMASITSLPELITGISSVTYVDSPDLATGDVLGSCMFNMLILSLMDARIKRPLMSLVKSSHLLAGLYGIILVSITGLAILINDKIPTIFNISVFSLVIIIVYIVTIYHIYLFDKRINENDKINESILTKDSINTILIKYVLNVVVVAISAIFLPYFGEKLSTEWGVSKTFFGTLFIATSTSFPELSVSFISIRMKLYDITVGNLLGSNLFNIFILAVDDFFYTKDALFNVIEKNHLISVVTTVIMIAMAGIGILVKSTRKIWLLSLDTFLILFLYVMLVIALSVF